MNLSKGYFPPVFTLPAIILLCGGYIFAGLYKYYGIEILSAGIAWPWVASFTGAIVLGRTKESYDDERINQIRNFSFRILSEFFIAAFLGISLFGLFGESWGTMENLPFILLSMLLLHLYHLKVAVLYGIDETTGQLKFGYRLLFGPYVIVTAILTYILFT